MAAGTDPGSWFLKLLSSAVAFAELTLNPKP